MTREMQDRSERFDLQVPVEFLCDGKIVLGQCLNISQSGVLARFEEPLELWTIGELRLHAGLRTCKVTARVSRITDNEAGLTFRPEPGQSPAASSKLVKDLIAAARELHGILNPPF